MNIRPVMCSPGHVPHMLPAPRLGEPELRRDRFSYPLMDSISRKLRTLGFRRELALGLPLLVAVALAAGCYGGPRISELRVPLDSRDVRSPERPNPRKVIVFVHGVGAHSTWLAPGAAMDWPGLVKHDPAYVDYEAYPVKYFTQLFRLAPTPEEVATQVLEELKIYVFSRFSEVSFVAHSMGGLVVKRILLKLARSEDPTDMDALQRVRAILFIGTPSQGSALAKLGAAISRNPQLSAIFPADSNAYLQSLESDWVHFLRARGSKQLEFPKVFCGYETVPLPILGQFAVSRTEATTLCDEDPYPINQDHFGIVKPFSDRDAVYVWARERVLRTASGDRAPPAWQNVRSLKDAHADITLYADNAPLPPRRGVQLETMPFPPSELSVNYKYQRAGNTVEITPQVPYLTALRSGGPIGPAYTDFQRKLATLSIKVVNNTRRTLLLTDAIIKVKAARVDTEPIIFVQRGLPLGIAFVNAGWGAVVNPVIEFAVSPEAVAKDEECERISAFGLPRHRVTPVVLTDTHIVVEIEKKVLPDNSQLGTDAPQDGPGLAAGDFEDYGSGRTYCIDGVLKYATQSGEERAVRFVTTMQAGFEGGPATAGLGRLPPTGFYDVKLEANEADYERYVHLEQKIESGGVDHFVIRVATNQSSRLDLKIWLRTADRSLIEGNDVTAQLFWPRSYGDAELEREQYVGVRGNPLAEVGNGSLVVRVERNPARAGDFVVVVSQRWDELTDQEVRRLETAVIETMREALKGVRSPGRSGGIRFLDRWGREVGYAAVEWDRFDKGDTVWWCQLSEAWFMRGCRPGFEPRGIPQR